MDDLKLTDLIDVQILQKVQDAFAEYSGMAAAIADADGVPVTDGSNFCRVCTELVRKTEAGNEKCLQFAREGSMKCMQTGRASIYGCHAGLVDFAVPIAVEGKIIGCCIGGQVRNEEKSEEEIRQYARDLDLDEEAFLEETRNTKIRTKEEVVESAIFLKKLANALSDMAFHNYLTIEHSRAMEETATARTHYMEGLYTDMAQDVERWTEEVVAAIDSGDTSEKERILQEMKTRGTDVQTFIRDTLITIRQKNASLSLQESVYSLEELGGKLQQFLQPSYAKKGNRLTIRIDEQVPKMLYGDAERVYRIFVALLYEAGLHVENEEIIFTIEKLDRGYATLLKLKIENHDTVCEDGRYPSISSYLQNRPVSESGSGEFDMQAAVMHSELSIVDTLLGQVFGGLEIVNEHGRGSTCYFSFPQLSAKKEEGSAL